jgi:hypothetical protein
VPLKNRVFNDTFEKSIDKVDFSDIIDIEKDDFQYHQSRTAIFIIAQ